MNKLFVLLFMTASLCASEKDGKLPEDFKFKAANEERRTSFMSQWKEYNEKVEGAEIEVHIKSEVAVDIESKTDEKGEIHITISEKKD